MGEEFDWVFRQAAVVTAEGVARQDLAVREGRVVAVAATIDGRGRQEVDGQGRYLFPGAIDPHVHFDEPGREEWEGIATGSRALAAGGGTLFFDMPLNSFPPTIDVESLLQKKRAAEAASVTDFALWGGIVPGNEKQREGLAREGAVGFKAFLCPTGTPEFGWVDGRTLREGMRQAADFDLPVAVHAESERIVTELTRRWRAHGDGGWRDYLASRPLAAEVEAAREALDAAGETGCALHLVHVSAPEVVELAQTARAQGVDVTVETCLHYLLFCDEDMRRLGTIAKCAPPLRSRRQSLGLWRALLAGEIDLLASDHSPCPPAAKATTDFFAAWGGISGCQHLLPLLLDRLAAEGDRAFPLAARLCALGSAHRFGIRDKGAIAVGNHADLTLVDLREPEPIAAKSLLYRHRLSPYVGLPNRVFPLLTLVRGEVAFSCLGHPVRARGRFLPGPCGLR
ncbi:Allantoinase [Methylacidimicrobium sp. AP8]|uniref:allantoinase AllB n=1 Tax=Methylacidimicrobium sp. AP8 TaxID=2730359 RepID=UPI0018C17A7D|nr:allantoinase AllB [Methylacidimicrobium sp. AP8]CAB4242736.1 Allantoinase [Methylacidimicrobium sp. AP8]